jgi:chemotaxis signal transduction protein
MSQYEIKDHEELEKVVYPWLVFKVKERLFAVNSENASSIVQIPKLVEPVPGSPAQMRGIINLRGSIIPLIDLRMVFGMTTMEQEYNGFKDMLEARKQDHLNWVNELKRCINTGEEFKLTTDPHKCAFGRWYDSYKTEVQSVKYHLNKIDEPHKRLHQAAEEVLKCEQKCDECKRSECLKTIMDRVSDELVPRIVSLLDEAKEVFRQQYHEMVIILDNGQQLVGIIVDEVVAVENLEKIAEQTDLANFQNSQYIEGVSQRQGSEALVILLNHQFFQL